MSPESNTIFKSKKDSEILKVVGWWERRRLVYNVLVAVSGIAGIWLSEIEIMPEFTPFVIIFGVSANLFYCLGWGIYVLRCHFQKGSVFVKPYGQVFFWLGTLFSIFITFLSL